jgi:photosystem II stability/assembly factor-like uncharacterized protein
MDMWNHRLSTRIGAGFLCLMFGVVGAAPMAAQSASPAKAEQNLSPAKSTKITGAQQKKEEEEGPDYLRERSEYFTRQRAYPRQHIPQGARLKALDQMHAMPIATTPLVTGVWESLGPVRILPAQGAIFGGSPTDSGRVSALAVDPTNHDTIYLGAAEGGVWKSTDGGMTWSALTDGQPSLAVGSIAIDPTNPQTIYVGTGEENFNGDSYYGAGILKSTDGGNTWTQLGAATFAICSAGSGGLNSPNAGSYIGTLAVDPGNNQVVLAATDQCSNYGVYRSADGGNTWKPVLGDPSGLAAPGTSVLFVGGGVAYAALGNFSGDAANGVYKSTDDGQTWTAVNGTGANVLPSGTTTGRISLAAAASNPLVLYAVVTSPTGFLGVYTTVDGGNNWTLTTAPNICTTQCFYDIAVAVSPTNPKIVYAGGIYTYATNTTPGSATTIVGSIDGGNTWTLVGSSTGTSTNGVHTDVHALTFSADAARLYVGSDGGAWKTSDFGNPAQLIWYSINSNLATSQFYPGFAYDGLRDAIGGTQDNGSQVHDPSSNNWSNVQCGDGGFSAIDTTTTPYTFYAACTFSQGIEKTTTPFTISSWVDANAGINTQDPALFIPPMVQDPSTPSTLYYGTNQIYQTTTGGSTWTSISPQPLPGSTGTVSAIAVAPSSGTTIYAGTSDSQVVVTTNGGTNWTNMSTGLPPRYVSHISINPTTPANAYVTFSGFSGYNGDTLGHVFQTTNGGGTWTDISGNLPNIPVNDIVIDPAVANTLYIATDIGVFTTSNGGTTWSTYGTGLPNVAVLSLVLEPDTRKLAAATHGRSAWRIDLAPASNLATVSLNPSDLLFAPQLINTASATQTTTLTVGGTVPLALTAITPDNPDFGVTTTCPLSPATLAPTTTCTISVTFTPSRTGLYNTRIRIVGNLTGGHLGFPVRATGTQDSITPSSLTFNFTPPQTSGSQNVTLNNVGTTPVHITSIGIISDGLGEFSQTNTCGAVLNAPGSCVVTVTFTGTTPGTDTAVLQVADDAANGAPELVSLTGTLQ